MKTALTSKRPQHVTLFIIIVAVSSSVAILLGVYSLRWILLTALIGLGLGVLLIPIVDKLNEKLKIPRGLASALLFFGGLGFITGISLLLYQLISNQIIPLTERIPEITANANKHLLALFAKYPWIKSQLESLNIGQTLVAWIQPLASSLKVGLNAIAGVFLTLVIALYTAADPKLYQNAVYAIAPTYYQSRLSQILALSATSLRQWFFAQMIAMISVGVLTGVGLWIIGIESWFLFGALTAIFDIIPYVGPLATAVIVSTVTLANAPEKLIWVVLTFVLMQQIESHLIIPMVLKSRIQFPPVYLILIMLILGSWFGIAGLLLAPGLFVIGRVFFSEIISPKLRLGGVKDDFG